MSRMSPAAARLPWCLVSSLALSCAGARPPAGLLTTVRELREAPRGSDPAVDVQGVATYFDADGGVLYLQDASGGLAVEVGAAPVVAGESIRLTGFLDPEAPV